MKPRRKVAECGTNGGYQAHYKRGEKPCRPCKDTHNAYLRDLRAAWKDAQ